MRAILYGGGSLLGLLLVVGAAPAQYFVTPVARMPFYPAPDACGPGFICYHPCGMTYGPSHYLVPPFAPMQPGLGMRCPAPGCPPMPLPLPVPGQPPPAKPQVYPTHPFARSPRDYFMWNEALEEQEGRSARPAAVP